MHPGWAETPGVAKSLPDFSERLAAYYETINFVTLTNTFLTGSLGN